MTDGSSGSVVADTAAPPVFIVGSARSGTTLLYHTLLSTGLYARYRGEPAVFDLLHPRYGDLRRDAARRRLLREWPRSHLAHASGFDEPSSCAALLSSVRSNGAFLRRVMSAMAERQGVPRWAVWGPDNLLLMSWIKRELPDARFIHMVRDGRDVALSLHTEGWIRPFPWDKSRALLVSALHWRWKLERGRREASLVGDDYMELAFETLVLQRDEALARVAAFLGHPVDPHTVECDALGTLRVPNSTFRNEAGSPVGRWRGRLSASEVSALEATIGDTLAAFGYQRSVPTVRPPAATSLSVYPYWYSAKHTVRTHTVLGRFVDAQRLRLTCPE